MRMLLASNYIMLSSSYEIQLKIDLVGNNIQTFILWLANDHQIPAT